MWMMGCNNNNNIVDDNSDDFNFHGRKLRPLVPRPTSSIVEATATCSTNNNNIPTSTPLFSSINHHHIEQGKSHHHQRECTTNVNSSQSMVVSSRWNPTPEQLMTLEDLYRRGTRTPSAEQIQLITAQLRRYGKIEGKNVFYWFQNHKARERQKRRRQQIESEAYQQHQQHINHQDIHGASKTEVFKVEQTKNCPIITKFAEQEFMSLRRGDEEIGWAQQIHTTSIKNGTWQMMQLSCPVLSCSNGINNNITTRTTERSMDPSSSSDHHDLNTTVEKKIKKKKNANYKDGITTSTTTGPKSQTLQLFPLETINEKNADRAINSSEKFAPHAPFQYFEFLPPKP